MHGPAGYLPARSPTDISELLYQMQQFHGFLWASGGVFSDFYIHQIDECCWMKDAWPVQAQAIGGRHYRGDCIDQNFDNYSVEYTFADGTKLFLYGRNMAAATTSSPATPTAPRARRSSPPAGTRRASAASSKARTSTKDELVWAFPQPEPNPYQLEWDDLIEAIRKDKPYNEAKRGAEASLVTSWAAWPPTPARSSPATRCSTCQHEFAPDVDKLTMDSPAPLLAGPDGKYPVPQPGIVSRPGVLSIVVSTLVPLVECFDGPKAPSFTQPVLLHTSYGPHPARRMVD